MHYALLVGFLQRLGDLDSDIERLPQRQRPFLQPIGQRFSLQQLHDDEVRPVLRADIVEMTDMRMR